MNSRTQSIQYRAAVEADFPVLVEGYTHLNNYFYTVGYHMPQPANVGELWLESFKRTLGRFSQVFVAEMNGHMVGFVLCRVKRVAAYMGGVLVGELSDIWVEPDARRLGVASELSQMVIHWLRDQGVHSIEIQVLEGNGASLRLFESLGFEPEIRTVRMVFNPDQPAALGE